MSTSLPLPASTINQSDLRPMPSWMNDTPPSINTTTHPLPFSLTEWINTNRHLLKPPVGNKMINNENCQTKVMVVGGPNTRTDYHLEEGEEWFYMIEGSMVLKIVDNGVFKDIVIHEGESYLLPANIPHSPQRPANSIGLVLEREREIEWKDHLRWYCRVCHHIIQEHTFDCTDLGLQLIPLIKQYYGSDEERTCKHCKRIDPVPTHEREGKEILNIIQRDKQLKQALRAKQQQEKDGSDVLNGTGNISYESKESNGEIHAADMTAAVNPATHPPPFFLKDWVASSQHRLQPPVSNAMVYGKNAQFKIMVIGGPNIRTDYHIEEGEEWFWQLKGDMVLKVNNGGVFQDIVIKEGQCFLLPARIPHSPQRPTGTLGLVVERERDPSLLNNHHKDLSQLKNEVDGIRWYCPNVNCRNILHTFTFYCYDLGSQLKPIIETWYSDEWTGRRTCTQCGTVDEKPMIPPSQHIE